MKQNTENQHLPLVFFCVANITPLALTTDDLLRLVTMCVTHSTRRNEPLSGMSRTVPNGSEVCRIRISYTRGHRSYILDLATTSVVSTIWNSRLAIGLPQPGRSCDLRLSWHLLSAAENTYVSIQSLVHVITFRCHFLMPTSPIPVTPGCQRQCLYLCRGSREIVTSLLNSMAAD